MKIWTAFKLGLIGAMTLVMTFHWEVMEARAEGHWKSVGRHRITHYCSGSCCNGRNAGRTASGAPMEVGRTVATGREYPFGTHLLINGQEYVVEDRGVGNGCIDILTGSHREALRKGLYYTEVFVWKED